MTLINDEDEKADGNNEDKLDASALLWTWSILVVGGGCIGKSEAWAAYKHNAAHSDAHSDAQSDAHSDAHGAHRAHIVHGAAELHHTVLCLLLWCAVHFAINLNCALLYYTEHCYTALLDYNLNTCCWASDDKGGAA